jgi:ssDNA-binding Zn-finger/Zn-ribbon topoisomerase 1
MRQLQNNQPINRYCPDCDAQGLTVRLIVKTNTLNGGQFLGCPRFPLCHFTAEIPEDLRMELAGQPRLFATEEQKEG